jgi:F420-dependent oxidoreductase-like protein
MKLGVIVEGQEGLTWDNWRRIAAAAEDLGFESLWRSDHLLSKLDEQRESLDTWLTLAVAAVETKRLRLGSLVSPITIRHPAMLAKMAAAVDVLSNGRLVLGLGSGWNEREHRAFGIPFPPPSERLGRLEEAAQVILNMFDEGPHSFRGRYYELDDVDPYPKPVQRPRVPLLIGGMGEGRTLRIVARYADEWNLTTASPSLYRARSERLEGYCAEIGRNPAEIRRSVAVGFLVGGSEHELNRRSEVMRGLIPNLASVDASEVPNAVRDVGWVAGTPDHFIECLRALEAEGVGRAMLQLNDLADIEALELIANEVMPALTD